MTKRASKGRRIAVRRSKIHGRGVFALQPIAAGERIIEYVGERISDAEIEIRYPEKMHELNHTFMFEVAPDVNIDGGRNGNSSRWINHSCAPNCEAIDEEGRIFIVALRRIRPGEELNYDYNIDAGERITPSVKRRWPCWCSARKCRGTVLVRASKSSD